MDEIWRIGDIVTHPLKKTRYKIVQNRDGMVGFYSFQLHTEDHFTTSLGKLQLNWPKLVKEQHPMLDVDKASTVEDLNTIIKTARERIKALQDPPWKVGDILDEGGMYKHLLVEVIGGKFAFVPLQPKHDAFGTTCIRLYDSIAELKSQWSFKNLGPIKI